MAKRVGPFRLAKWGRSTPDTWRGWSVALMTKKRVMNIELHYERKGKR